ncbi:MAG: flagellar basal-body rod protein FlgF [Rhizobiaceae bacterium]
METGIYVALSSQMAAEKRLASLADNVANVNTVGFRETQIRFGELVDRKPAIDVSFVHPVEGALSGQQGAIDLTGNDLDFAINGEGWFQVHTPAGNAVTRDGRFSIGTDGILSTVEGYPVLDQGESPVQISRANGPVHADAGGILYQNNTIIGSIGVFDAPTPQENSRVAGLAILPQSAATAAVDRTDFSVQQGFVERSNVNAVKQITTLISVQRNFEEVSGLMQQSEASVSELIRMLGGK